MNRIKHFRRQKDMTVRELSNKSKVAVSYLSDLENNKCSNPSKEVMERVACALEQSVPDVFFPNEEVC